MLSAVLGFLLFLSVVGIPIGIYFFLRYKRKKKKIGNTFGIYFNKVKSIPELDDPLIEVICEWLVDFWSIQMKWDREDCKAAIHSSKIQYIEQSSMIVNWIDIEGKEHQETIYGGVTYPYEKFTQILTVPFGNSWQTPLQRIVALTKHELSHTLVGNMDRKYASNEGSHELFEKVKLDQQSIKFKI